MALYYIERVKHSVDLSLDENDSEVAAIEKRDADEHAAFVAATTLEGMPLLPKILLVSGSAVLALSAYLLIFASSECFEDFALTDEVTICFRYCDRPIIKPLGWVALSMLSCSLVFLYAWRRWAHAAVAQAATSLV